VDGSTGRRVLTAQRFDQRGALVAQPHPVLARVIVRRFAVCSEQSARRVVAMGAMVDRRMRADNELTTERLAPRGPTVDAVQHVRPAAERVLA
jgi:hypothetical protein